MTAAGGFTALQQETLWPDLSFCLDILTWCICCSMQCSGKHISLSSSYSFAFSYTQVVQRIKAVEHETRLLVVDRETDEYFRSLRLTCTEEMAIRMSPAATTPSPSPSTSKQGNGSVSKRPEISKPIRKPLSRAPKKVWIHSLSVNAIKSNVF